MPIHPAQRALIFVNGEVADFDSLIRYVRPDDYMVAVDGGYAHMQRLNLIPHLVIGDMDSIDKIDLEHLAQQNIEIHQYPVEKNETDLELALNLVIERGYKVIRLIGSLGGRFDQSLGNLMLLTRPSLIGQDIRMEDGVTEAFFFLHRVQLEGKPGDIVSLLPVQEPARQIVTEGLYYPLRAETLWTDRTRGISNVMTGSLATIHIGSGALLCIHIRKNIDGG